jgi:hypothetical protein
MNFRFSILKLFLLLLILGSCKEKQDTPSLGDKVTIGTFNMEWLGDGINDRKDRTEDDYRRIADVITNSGIDVIGVQEIENAAALERVIKYLPDFDFILGKGGKAQKVGIIYRKNISVISLGDYQPIEVAVNRTRPGLVAQCKAGNFDWIMMVVHLKSTSRFDDTEDKREESLVLRSQQAAAVRKWADSTLNYSDEKDIIIVGDFNDSPIPKKNPTLEPLLLSSDFKFLTADLKSCKYKNLPLIDHIVASNSACRRMIDNSTGLYNFYPTMSKELQKSISDHCPVFTVFDITAPDNDGALVNNN